MRFAVHIILALRDRCNVVSRMREGGEGGLVMAKQRSRSSIGEGGGGEVRLVLNNKENSTVNYGCCRRRDVRISALLCAEAARMWRESSSDHKDAMHDGDDDEDAAWEQA